MDDVPEQQWTVDSFLDWAARQETNYEFDGVRPVAMVGSTGLHNRICQNIYFALRLRLRGSGCSSFGPDMGVRTEGMKIRCPDALINRGTFDLSERLAPHPVVVFDVLSRDSGRRDRIVKVAEYASVPSILQYFIVESTKIGLLVMQRESGDVPFTAEPLKGAGILHMPGAGIAVPVAEFYEDIAFAPASSNRVTSVLRQI
jgi:Uma2 family endonuclease